MVSLPLVPARASIFIAVHRVVGIISPSLSTRSRYLRPHHSQTCTHTQSTLRSIGFPTHIPIPPPIFPDGASVCSISRTCTSHTVIPRIWHYTRRADVRWACTRSGSAPTSCRLLEFERDPRIDKYSGPMYVWVGVSNRLPRPCGFPCPTAFSTPLKLVIGFSIPRGEMPTFVPDKDEPNSTKFGFKLGREPSRLRGEGLVPVGYADGTCSGRLSGPEGNRSSIYPLKSVIVLARGVRWRCCQVEGWFAGQATAATRTASAARHWFEIRDVRVNAEWCLRIARRCRNTWQGTGLAR